MLTVRFKKKRTNLLNVLNTLLLAKEKKSMIKRVI